MRKFLALFFLATAALCLLEETVASPIVPESQKKDIVIPGKNGNNIKITVLNDKPAPKINKVFARKAVNVVAHKPVNAFARKALNVKARKQGDYSYNNIENAVQNIPSCTGEIPSIQEIDDIVSYLMELGNQYPEGDTLSADAGYMELAFCSLAKFYAVSDQLMNEQNAANGDQNAGSSGDQGDNGASDDNGDDGNTDYTNGDAGDQGTGSDDGNGNDDPYADGGSTGSADDIPNPDYNGGDDNGTGSGDDSGNPNDIPNEEKSDAQRNDPQLVTYPDGYAVPNDDGSFTVYKPDGSTEVVATDYFDENPDSPYAIVYQRKRVVRKAARINIKKIVFNRRNSIQGAHKRVAQFRNIFKHSL